jgi:hypothetical protein
MRDDSLATLAWVKGLEVVAPQPGLEGESLCAEHGYTPTGAVNTLVLACKFLGVETVVVE